MEIISQDYIDGLTEGRKWGFSRAIKVLKERHEKLAHICKSKEMLTGADLMIFDLESYFLSWEKRLEIDTTEESQGN